MATDKAPSSDYVLANIKRNGVQVCNAKYVDANGQWNLVKLNISQLEEGFVQNGIQIGDCILLPYANSLSLNPCLETPVLAMVCEMKSRAPCPTLPLDPDTAVTQTV